MKKPSTDKLPSGKFRARLQVNNKRYSAIGSTKKEAQDKVLQLYLGFEVEKKSPLTVGKAMDRYISEKTGTLSPSTIKGYYSIRKNYLQSIMNLNLNDLTQSDIQLAVSSEAVAGKSPKTIRNAHGLLAAVLDEFRPGFLLNTRLPQKQKYEARILSEEEMGKVFEAAKGSKYELPILLAAWLGLRMSEIRGIKYEDIQDGYVHVHRAMVAGPNGDVEKGTKTTAGDRWIKLPEEILYLINNKKTEDEKRESKGTHPISEEYICPWADITIYKNFINVCKKAGVEPCTFHELRHFAASEALALGIPDKYSMKRMGHKTDNMLKFVYQHTMKAKEEQFSDLIDEKMRKIYKSGHENGHTDEKSK